MTISRTEAGPAVPEGFVVHTESTTSILFAAPPSSSGTGTAPVFLNPVQEYNRDLSVVAIRTWSEARQAEKRKYWEEGLRRKWARKRARDLNGAGGDGAEKFAKPKSTGAGEDEGKGKGKEATAALKEGEADGQADAKRRKAEDGTAAVAPVAAGAGGSGEATTTTTRVSSSFRDT